VRKTIFLVSFLLVIVASFAGILELAPMLPSDSQMIIVVENLPGSYAQFKKLTLGDSLLNQLALEQTISQQIELVAYNNGVDPSSVYAALSGDLAIASWATSENEYKMIIILGPINNPKSVASALKKVLDFFLPFEFEILVDSNYLFIGNVTEYANLKKGISVDALTGDLEPGISYLYMRNTDILSRMSFRYSDNLLLGQGYTIPLSDKAKEQVKTLFSGMSINDLEELPHLPLAGFMFRANDLPEAEELLSTQLNFSLMSEKLGISQDILKSISRNLTGTILVDIDLPMEELFNNLFAAQQSNGNANTAPTLPVKTISRIGYMGTLEEVKNALSAKEVDVTINEDVLKTDKNVFIWKNNRWLYTSNLDKSEAYSALDNSTPYTQSSLYQSFLKLMAKDRFLTFFMDTGYILSALFGTEIQSGIMSAAWYSDVNTRIEGLMVIK
jgi:hypothetical protein